MPSSAMPAEEPDLVRLADPATLATHPEPSLAEPGATAATPIDFLTVGHVARDVLPAGWRLGGAVAFAARQAQRLGRRPAVVTSAGPEVDLDLGALVGISVHIVPATLTTCYENHYDGGSRQQWLRARASPIEAESVPRAWWSAAVLLLAPIAGEVGDSFSGQLDRRGAGLTGLALQGWLRDWDSSGRVRFSFWRDPGKLLERSDFAFVSEEDLAAEPRALSFYADRTPCLVVTRGPLGCAI